MRKTHLRAASLVEASASLDCRLAPQIILRLLRCMSPVVALRDALAVHQFGRDESYNGHL
jgi:hypothetical protein